MSRAELSNMTCSVARTLEIVGDSWSLMVLRELFLGSRRFDDLRRQTGGSPHLISQRLKRMEAEGIVTRRAYQQRPVRHEYRLTDKGIDLWPVIVTLKDWGDRWGDWPDEVPLELVHKDCGHTTAVNITCTSCNATMSARDVRPQMSPAMTAERQEKRG